MAEGESEGVLVGNLAKELIASTDRHDLYGFVAVDRTQIVGAILFSRLRFETDIDLFPLAPVAVHSDHQGMGIGQALITHGLQKLKERGVEVLTT